MKIIKRIIAVFLLVLMVALVGYLVYTGNRLSSQVDEQSAGSLAVVGYEAGRKEALASFLSTQTKTDAAVEVEYEQ